MKNITTSAELKMAIQLLEAEQEESGQQLKDEIFSLYESLKPVNLIRSSIKEMVSSPNIIDDLISMGLGVVTGYISKKLVSGGSGNSMRMFIGSALQMGITALATQNLDTLRIYSRAVIETLMEDKKPKTEQD